MGASAKGLAAWSARHTRQGVFSALHNRNLRTYLGGQAVSLTGTWMQATAQSWVVWQISHSTAALGTVSMLSMLPSLVLGPWSGAAADRFIRRRLLLATQTLAMCAALVFAVLVQTDVIQLWHIYLLALVLGCSASLDWPAQQAFIGDLAGVDALPKAVVLNAMIFQSSRMLGPAAAGWIIGQFGVAPAFWVNGASFLAVIGSLLVVRAEQTRKVSPGSPWRDFRETLGFIGTQPRLQDMLLFSFFVTFFGISNMQLMPAVATDVLGGGPETLGVLLGASGFGSLVSSVLIVPYVQRARRTGMVLGFGALWAGVGYILLSLSHRTGLSALAVFTASMAIPPIMTTAMVVLQLLAPPDMRARLLSTRIMLSFGIQPFGVLAVGYGAHFLGAPTMIRINGLLLLCGPVLLLGLRRDLRHWQADILSPTRA